jgi:hypothetical protein
MNGDKIHIHYDDGEREHTTIRVVRVLRGPADHPWREGDRVLALWPPEPFLYPAVIKRIEDEALMHVDYDDGDRAVLTPDVIFPIELRAGQPVFARRNRRVKQYHPGVITQVSGEELHVRYDEGGEEWIAISFVRLLPPALEEEYLKSRGAGR